MMYALGWDVGVVSRGHRFSERSPFAKDNPFRSMSNSGTIRISYSRPPCAENDFVCSCRCFARDSVVLCTVERGEGCSLPRV